MANFTQDAMKALTEAQDEINKNTEIRYDGSNFLQGSSSSPDDNGLPYSKVPSNKPAQLKRNIITWFVPEFGTVRMYINPQSMSIQHKKSISKDRTKGGFTLQYWGEEITAINIAGVTGSAGVEGINMLYEIYRAEQYAGDSIGLTLAAANNNAASLATRGVDAIGNAVGGALGAGLLGGILGTDSANANALASKNIMTLAQMAFSVEMFYNGVIYKGYFDSMTIDERADNFLLDYTLTFNAIQKRGYRTNYFPWTRSANQGPSQYNTPLSLDTSNTTR